MSAGNAIPDPDRVAELFAEMVAHPPGERAAWLERRASGSALLRRELESLLAAHERSEQAEDFLEELDRRRGAALVEEAARAETAGKRLGPWRLLQEIGRGGMGVVYLAERAEGGFQQRVAVKVVKRGMDSDAILRRFLRERQILAGLDHPGIARLLDGGVTTEGQPYFAMELVEGEPLTAWCESRRFGLRERLVLFEEACRAVQYAHGQLVVHRDLKPSNMLVTAEGRLKLLDFGVARLLGGVEEGAGRLTGTGFIPLTPQYAAPEQVRGGTITTATDVYALGLILYELVAGRLPYGSEERSREELSRAIQEADPAPPAAAAVVPIPRALKADLDAIVLKALRKEPERRYGSAEALAQDVGRFLAGQPVHARPDSVRYRASKFVRRHRAGVGAASAAAICLLIGLAGTAWQGAAAARERDRARLEADRSQKVTDFLAGLFRASDPAEAQGRELTARELLERGTERIDAELSGEPAMQAELLHAVAYSFHSLGLFDRAGPIEERSLELFRGLGDPGDPKVGRGLRLLGAIAYGSGRLAEAERANREATAIFRKSPERRLDLAEALAGLALVQTRQVRLEEAETHAREALAIRREELGPEHPQTVGSLVNLADLLHAKGEYAAAAGLHRQAVDLRRRLRGDRHPEVARALTSLAITQLAQGDLTGAERSHREALGMRRDLLGEKHPHVASSLHHLGAVLAHSGDLAGAEAAFREGLALDRELRGEEHSDVANALANLAHVLSESGRFDEAVPLFEQALALHRKVTDPGHPMVAQALEKQASALVAQERVEEAVPILERSLSIFRERYGAEHPRTAQGLAKLADAKGRLGAFGEAERLFREALRIQERARPGPQPVKVEALLGLGDLLCRQNRAAEAEPPLRDALAQAAQVLPEGHWKRGAVESIAGACLRETGAREEAAALLRSGHARLREALGEGHPETLRALRRLETLESLR